jgi:hypothetical protein
MSGIIQVFERGPRTYTVTEAVLGGQLVEGRTASAVGVAAAGSTTVLGVALKDATNAAPSATDAYPLSANCPVARGCEVRITYAANCAFGKAVKAAATGQVTRWVSGTDAADLIVGYCREVAGATATNLGLTFIR